MELITICKDCVIKLVSETFESDENGNQKSTKTENTYFATLDSIAQSEFFSAGQSGFKPEYKIVMWGFEYNNQEIIIMKEKNYSVYRTFLRDDERIELYVTSKVGV